MRLSDFASDEYSQFGEDGQIAEVFRRIGESSSFCVEFGASDGLNCSNTARLWKGGWRAVLIESDSGRFAELEKNADGYDVTPICASVAPTGLTCVDVLLAKAEIDYRVDFMSIDVDGDDYVIWDAMGTRPRVICIEYNQSIPPHVDLRQARQGDCFGASALSLVRLGESKGYDLVGLSRCNLLFVDRSESEAFRDLERDLDQLFDYSRLAYVVTDYHGRPALVGDPPWGLDRESYLRDLIGGPVRRLPIFPVGLFQAYERIYGAVLVTYETVNVIDLRPEAQTQERLAGVLGPAVIGIDLSHVCAEELHLTDWVRPFAAEHGYRVRMDPGLMTLIRNEIV